MTAGQHITRLEALADVRSDMVLWALRMLTAETVAERFAAVAALAAARAMYQTIAARS